mmetsp:Transcript_2890/g.5348  ORF Transcript_2890/g.5348 Transcript_2890/m.5348 type:complete len:371 (+) Transcript_2890:228-1340(+)
MSEYMSERVKRMKRETSLWSEDYNLKDERPVRTEPSRVSGHMEGGARTESREAGEKSFGPPVKGGEERGSFGSSSKEESNFIPGPSQTKAPKRGKSKKRKRMKDPLTPKNPLSAYLFFVVKQRSSGSENSKDSFSATAKKIGQKWRAMTHEEKMPFIQLAKYDKQRYLREKYEYLMSKSRTKPEEPYDDPYRMVRMRHNDQKQVQMVAVQERYAPVNIPISYAPAPQPDYRIMPYNPHPPPPQVCLVPAHHASPPPMVFYTHTQQPPPLVRVEARTYDRSTPRLTTTLNTHLAAHTQPILDTQSHDTQPQAVLDTQAQYTQKVLGTQGHYTHTQPVHTQSIQDTQGQQHWQPLQQQQHSSAPPYEQKYHW